MEKFKRTKENQAKVYALKKSRETRWVGNTIHDNMTKCLSALNLQSLNSGWYDPVVTRIRGMKGFFMVNEDGGLFCEARIIKEEDKKFRIEYLTSAGWNDFENDFIRFLDTL